MQQIPILPKMNLSTPNFESSATSVSPPSAKKGTSEFLNDDTQGSGSSLYQSALDNLTIYSSFNESANNNSSTATINSKSQMNSSTDIDATLNGCELNMSIENKHDLNTNINASMFLIQSESTETNASQEEVDPKSQLANKTVFKSHNPNLSIIEINDNSIKEQNSVVVVEPVSDDEDDKAGKKLRKSPNKATGIGSSCAAEKRRKRTESFINSSKQKLNVEIAEASALESINNGAPSAEDRESNVKNNEGNIEADPEQKREIKIYDTIEEFEKNLPSTVTVLYTPFGSKVYLVGTAHFSEESQNDVSLVIRNVRPDVVMVELCPSRIHILKLDEKTLLEEAKNFNLAKIRSIIHAHGYINGIFFIMLLQMSAQIAKDLGMAPGGEFRRAFEEIHKLPGCMLHLGDRPIRITLHRALKALSLWQTLKLVWRLTSTDTISIEEVEKCKQRDLLEKLMQEMAGEFPAFSDVFVRERDLFLCHSLQLAALPQASADGSGAPRPVRVVGVVGIGHAYGIARMWGRVDPQKIPAIMEIPPASLSTRVCKYTIKYGLISLILFGAYKFMRPRISRFF